MKTSKILDKLQDALGLNKKKKRAEALKSVLKKLKKKEAKLKDALHSAKDDKAKASLKQKIATAHAQRKKGVKALRALSK